MNRKQKIQFLLSSLALALLFVGPVAAGNWVLVTFESLPESIRAGETVRFDFAVRQHGQDLVDGLSPILTATNPETGERIQAAAAAAGETGLYTASLTFPEAGEWEWTVATPPFQQGSVYEPLTVLPAASAVDAAPAPDASAALGTLRVLLRWLGMGLVALAALLVPTMVWRRRSDATPRTA